MCFQIHLNMLRTLLLLLFPLFAHAQTIHYVNVAANGQNNGTSWTDAFTNLQNALAAAQPGDEVWVAQGTYFPTTDTNRDTSFTPKSGTRLFGGFNGTETARNQRNWGSFPVVLSGDIGVAGDSTDNSRNIMYLFEPDSNTVVDGFVFRHGQATNTVSLSGRPRQLCGGGLYIMGFNGDAYARVANCTFEYCTAKNFGGGAIVNGGGMGSSVSVSFVNCTFRNNRCLGGGGGLCRFGGSMVERTQDLAGCIFEGNTAQQGGGLYYVHQNGSDEFAITNCQFLNNRGTTFGGAMNAYPERSLPEKFRVDSCLFDGNVAKTGAVIYTYGPSGSFAGIYEILNCTISNHIRVTADDNQAIFIEYTGSILGIFRFYNSMIVKNSRPNDELIRIIFVNSKMHVDKIQSYDNECTYTIFMGELNTLSVSNSYFKHPLDLNSSFVFHEEAIIRNSTFISTGDTSYIFLYINRTQKVDNCTFVNAKTQYLFATGPNDTLLISNSIIDHKFYPNEQNLEMLNMGGIQIYTNNYFKQTDTNLDFGPKVHFTGTTYSGISPMFRDSANGDFRLLPCSPLINAGTNSVVQPGDTDLDGQPRLQGGIVDIGAYESASLALSAPAEVLPACVGSSNGSIVFAPDNACLPLQFNWSGPVSGSGTNLSGLPSGTYQITITDGKNETLQTEVNVGAATPPQATVQTTPVMCGTNIGGSATPVVEGNWPPYQFNWSNSSTDSVAMQLPAGAYLVTITDARGCTDTGTAQVNRLGSISVQILPTEISCYNTTDGALEIQPANGVAPFHWLWASGDTTAALQNLGEGIYSGFLTDGLNCAISWNIPLESPDSLRSNADIAHATGPNTPNGSIDLSPTGGTGNISVLWSTGDINFSISGLLPGTYTVTLTDDNGCSSVEQHVVTSEVSSNNPARPPMVKVFPNPAHERINWTGMDADRARLWSSTGALVRESTGNFMPLNGVPGGAYTLEIVGKGGVFRGRITVF